MKQIIIPGFAVPAIRADLQKYGIDDTTIFPDLAGLGRALVTSYESLKRPTPHKSVYVRLKPSKLHKSGVGVFAVIQIPPNTRVFAEENEEIRWIPKNSVPKTGPFRKLYDDFSIIKDGRYGCPVSFNRLTPAWFLNDSKTPNVRCDDNYDFYTLRKINAGEEITVDYETFSENP